MKRGLATGMSLLALGVTGPAARAADRYELAGGCYELRSKATGKAVVKTEAGAYSASAAAGQGEPFRMQATSLGAYLLYGRAKDFLAGEGSTVSADAQPSGAADWVVDGVKGSFTLVLPGPRRQLAIGGDEALTLVDEGTGGDSARFAFEPVRGCAVYPEADVGATGSPLKGDSPYGEVRGFVDPHFHLMAFEFLGGRARCGRPWHPYGITHAMVDCPDHEPNGEGAVLENFLTSGTPVGTHDTVGWPTFKDWPRHNSLTHEGAYWKGLERAWMGGLRLFTLLLVDNAVLCEIYPYKNHGCNEMDTIRLELQRTRELEAYIDAQSGGPGKGWFRVVRDPFEARRVINDGKLAVVLGIENSKLFDCGVYNDVSECTTAQIDAQLEEFHAAGVRQMEIVNKFDNALVGVAGDAGYFGILINNANKYETGQYWAMETCGHGDEHVHDEPQETLPGGGDALAAGVLGAFGPPGAVAPVYGPRPHCNQRGLRPEGEYLIRRMMEKKMIFDPDHMSVAGRKKAMELIERAGYSGVISSHSWSTPDVYPAIYRLGGLVTPIATSSKRLVEEWKRLKPLHRDERFLFGFGYGSDMNGFHTMGGPRDDAQAKPLTYPFKSFDGGVTLDRQRWGERVWDINVDGVAQYGMFPDWIEDARLVGGDGIVQDLANGAEAYLQMWERTHAIKPRSCLPTKAAFSGRGLGAVALELSPEALLRAAGQPAARPRRAFRYCVTGAGSARRVNAVFTPQGRVGLVTTTARSHRARGVAVGARAARLGRSARRLGSSAVRVRRAPGGRRFVYGVRGGRVRWAGLASRAVASTPARLRSHLKLAGLR